MMSNHELFALRHPRIVEFHKFYSEYHIFLEAAAERFKVSIRVFETHDGRFFFEQSHYLRTPVQSQIQTTVARPRATPKPISPLPGPWNRSPLTTTRR